MLIMIRHVKIKMKTLETACEIKMIIRLKKKKQSKKKNQKWLLLCRTTQFRGVPIQVLLPICEALGHLATRCSHTSDSIMGNKCVDSYSTFRIAMQLNAS